MTSSRRFRFLDRRPLSLPDVDPDGPPGPCIVHLVRFANGLVPFNAFLHALRSHPAGLDCEVVLAMKGFARPADAEPYFQLAEDLSPTRLFFSDDGLDLTVYLAVANALRRNSYCFLNSYSRPLIDGWLAKLGSALAQPGVGISGATGSWGSSRSWKAYQLHLPSAYNGMFPGQRFAREQLEPGIHAPAPPRPQPSPLNWLRARANGLREVPLRARVNSVREVQQQILPFDPFPSHHIRTNGFMIAHATLVKLQLRAVNSKRDAYLLENGRASITRQVQRMGMRAVIVDRDGAVFDSDRWDRSRTFWQGDQEGLLIADNQTRHYLTAEDDRRRVLSAFAWGTHAEPHLNGLTRSVGDRQSE